MDDFMYIAGWSCQPLGSSTTQLISWKLRRLIFVLFVVGNGRGTHALLLQLIMVVSAGWICSTPAYAVFLIACFISWW